MFFIWAGLGVAALILSLKTGLILGMSGIRGSHAAFVSLAFGASLGILVMIFLPCQGFLVSLLDKYTFLGSIAMAIFLIYLGIGGKDVSSSKTGGGFSPKYIAAFFPCPLCLIALALTIIILSPGMDIPPVILGWIIAGIFFLMLIAIAFGFRKLITIIHIRPQSGLDGLLLFLGIFTLCCGLLIPHFVESMSMPFAPVAYPSEAWILGSILGMAAVIAVGFLKYNFLREKENGDRW